MRSGDPCDKCVDGVLRTYSTVLRDGRRTRYLRCTHCQATAKQHFVDTRPQKKRRGVTTGVANATIGRCPTCCILLAEGSILSSFDDRRANMIDVRQLAQMLAVDLPTCLRLVRDGSVPPPRMIGVVPRFDLEEIHAWRRGGCPSGDPAGHRVMNAIRRQLLEDESAGCANQAADISYLLDNASPETLARVEYFF